MSTLPTCGLARAAEILRCHESTVAELARAGKIRGRKAGRAWVFLEADIIDFIRGGECRSTSGDGSGGSTSPHQEGGERIRRSTRASDRAAAQRIHDEFRAELWKRRRRGGTFHGALKAWQSKLPKGNPDRYRVGKPLALPDRSIDDVTGEWLASVLPASSPGTFNRYANLVCAALAKAGHPVKIARHSTAQRGAP